ncbi:MucR family transcriptional regulator [Oleisolibacter albus]|uniref:MucR family transcriptional regulator n=1 Tax=Oleisolibacter albus TaxID=2171757 RepID=UPI000DF20566|nr:MucR family transcriptional regulator [Oleisolibacter albus]
MSDLVGLTAKIISAYVSNNPVEPAALPDAIQAVHIALANLGKEPEPVAEPLVPAVPIKKSVTPSHIICLEDGKKLKMLKRYLKSTYGMTPEEYRARWGLPKDYPMTAPDYAEQRSTLAKQIGLGRKSRRA